MLAGSSTNTELSEHLNRALLRVDDPAFEIELKEVVIHSRELFEQCFDFLDEIANLEKYAFKSKPFFIDMHAVYTEKVKAHWREYLDYLRQTYEYFGYNVTIFHYTTKATNAIDSNQLESIHTDSFFEWLRKKNYHKKIA